MHYIFGPVPSRRLGLSLGVDLMPAKTCTYDCIYCQLGRTTNHTSRRADFIEPVEITAELRTALAKVKPDYHPLRIRRANPPLPAGLHHRPDQGTLPSTPGGPDQRVVVDPAGGTP